MNPLYRSPAYVGCYENDLDAFVPELWAHQGLAVLQENMVMANLVHRDFEDTIAKFGDVVNTRRPGEFKIRRKEDGTPLVQQDAKATNVPVLLDQWFYESFVIRDGEGSKSFQELTELYLRPAMQGIAGRGSGNSGPRSCLPRHPCQASGEAGRSVGGQCQGLRARSAGNSQRQQGPGRWPPPGVGSGCRDGHVEDGTLHQGQ